MGVCRCFLHWLVDFVFYTYFIVWIILICPAFATFQAASPGVCSLQLVPSYKKEP